MQKNKLKQKGGTQNEQQIFSASIGKMFWRNKNY